MSLRLKHIQDWLEVAVETDWSASALAKRCGVSLRTLERHFLAKMGKSPKAWLTEQRQQIAGQLLDNGNTVKEAAHSLNFKHPSHLTNGFKKHWGHPPTRQTNPPEKVS